MIVQLSTPDPNQRLSSADAVCSELGTNQFVDLLTAQLAKKAPLSNVALSGASSGAAFQVGDGARLQTAPQIFAPAASTQNTIDVALQGSGFFVVKGLDGDQLFTRAGRMSLDSDGFLMTQAGLKLEGFKIDARGDATLTSAPHATSAITLGGTLSADPSIPILAGAFDPKNISGTSNFSSAAQVFDSRGNPYSVDIHFKRTGAGLWEWNATVDGSNIEGGVAGTSQIIGFGTLAFDELGALTDVWGNTVTFNPVGSSFDLPMTLRFGSPQNGVPPGSGRDGLVQTGTVASKVLDTDELFTRAGQMTLDKDGVLVTQVGLRVQGLCSDTSGVCSSALCDLKLASATSAPQVTSVITLRGNLNANPGVPMLLNAFDPNNISGTSDFSSAAQVFDSRGNPYSVDIHFKRTGAGLWEWNATMDGSDIEGGLLGTPQIIGFGTLAFDEDGALTDVWGNTVTFNPVGSSFDQPMTLHFGSPQNGVPPGSGRDGVVQTSTIPSSMSFVGQDGFGAGTLTGMRIDEQGNIDATFSNGRSQSLGQVAVVSGALEQANVGLSDGLFRTIVAQHYVQTADQLLQELVKLKR